jgi:hypothetical protein
MANKKYRKAALLVILALTLACCSAAQYKRPVPRTQPRGTAVVERLPGGKMRLIPVCIFYESKFYDAQFYQIHTVPMALQGDTLYEVQRAGEPIGLFTVETAFRNGARWSAEGKWKNYTLADKRADDLRQQQRAIAQAKDDKAAPGEFRLPGGGGGRSGKRNPKDKGGDTSKSGGDSKTDKSGSTDSDPDRPTLHRRDDSKSGENTPPADDDPDRPTLKHKEDEKPAPNTTAANAESQPEPTRDADRPKLRHNEGKEQSGADLPNASPSAGAAKSKAAALPEATYVAVSDPQPVESRSMNVVWTPEEQQDVARKMEALAQAEVRKALPMRVARLAPKVLPFTDVDSRAFDLDGSNNAIVVLTAAYAAPLNGPGATGGTAQSAPYRVVLVARQNAEGQLFKLMSRVSDPADLDASPELRLVDAIDVDGDGRGELLFRKSSASGTGWLVERVTPYETEAIFDGAAH